MSSPSLKLSFIVQTRAPFSIKIFKTDIIIKRLRPRRESSEQIMMSPLFTHERSFPSSRLFGATVPLTVSSIHASTLRCCFLLYSRISKRWFSTVCLFVLTRMYPYVILILHELLDELRNNFVLQIVQKVLFVPLVLEFAVNIDFDDVQFVQIALKTWGAADFVRCEKLS